MDNISEQIKKPPPNEESAGKDSVDGVNDMIHNQDEMTALEKVTETTKEIALIDNGASSKPPHKKKLPILNVESVRTLLEHRFHMVWSKETSDSNFLKYLFVSKVFFNVARRYPIFCLAVSYRSEDALLTCLDLSRFKPQLIREAPKLSNGFFMSYEKMRPLLSILKPNHFVMAIDNSNFSNENVMKAIENLEFIHGKIGLVLSGNFQAELSLLLDQFSRRKLGLLECLSDFLTRSNVSLKIGHYDALGPINNVQFHNILSHTLDSFRCEIDGSFIDEAASLPSLSSGTYNSLKWVGVNCNHYYDSLMAFLDMIKDKCSKLETLSIFVMILSANGSSVSFISDADEILNCVLHAKGSIQKIVEKCRPLTSSLKIFSVVPMYYTSDDEFSCDWIEQAKTIGWFKDAIHEETVEQEDDRQFNICHLTSKFCDGFLELDHKTMVFRALPE